MNSLNLNLKKNDKIDSFAKEKGQANFREKVGGKPNLAQRNGIVSKKTTL